MRPVLSALMLLLALPLSAPASNQNKASYAKDLHALFDAEWERGLRENPVGATPPPRPQPDNGMLHQRLNVVTS